MDNIAIEIKNLNYSIRHHIILQDVNLTVNTRSFLAIIGPNGGGKTTLLKLMLGLYTPDSGDIRIFGGTPENNAHRIGYVPQQIDLNTHFPISVMDVVMMGRLRPGWGWSKFTPKDKEKAEEALNQMDMWPFRHRGIGELSGGQRQRVYIARALASDPDILFLDEPTASVDTQGQTEFYEILKSFNKDITIVIVSHDFMALSAYVKSVACVNRTLYYHNSSEITNEMVDMHQCPIELVAHGIPHRVLKEH